jgi:hypothetical protein
VGHVRIADPKILDNRTGRITLQDVGATPEFSHFYATPKLASP